MGRPKGFTLIELLITVALVSAISIFMFYFTHLSIQVMSKAVENARSAQVVRFIAGRLSSDVIQSSGASPTSGPNKLVIGDITYEFRERKLRRQEGGDVYYLTTEGEINNIRFSYPSSKYIKIEITPGIGEVQTFNVYARN